MKASKILSNLSLSKIWGELTSLNENMASGFSSITTKINTLEELVMSNAGTSEIYETARARIVNSALGKALGMTADTQIIDAAISIEGVANNGAWNGNITTSGGSVVVPAGYHNGSGKVTGPTLSNLIGSNVNATAADHIVSGYTAYGKNGVKLTGNATSAVTITKILDKYGLAFGSASTLTDTIPANTGTKYIIITKVYRGSSTADQLEHSLTFNNGTATSVYTKSTSSQVIHLWTYTKTTATSAATMTITANRTDANGEYMVFAVPNFTKISEVTVDGNTDANNYTTTVAINDSTGGTGYCVLSVSSHGNTTAGTLVHTFKTNNGLFNHCWFTITDSYCINLWFYIKKTKSTYESLIAKANRGNATIDLTVLKLF